MTATPTKPDTHAGLQFRADLALLTVALIWGVNIPIMKSGLEKIDVFVFNFIRLAISAVVLSLFALAEPARSPASGPGLSWKKVILYGVIVSGMYQVSFLIGVANTTSGNTALIMATVPLWTALLARLFGNERIGGRAWFGLVIALVGTAVVAFQKGDVTLSTTHGFGNLVILAAAMIWAGGTVYSRPLLKSISPLRLAAVGGMLALPIHFLFASSHLAESAAALQSPRLWGIICYSGLLSTGLALPLWNYGIQHAGASHAAVVQNVSPAFAIVAAWLIRGEQMTTEQIYGGALILGGLIVMRMARQAQPVAEPVLDKTS